MREEACDLEPGLCNPATRMSAADQVTMHPRDSIRGKLATRFSQPGMEGKPRDRCAVFGVYAPGEQVATMTYFALYALQHRGQESSGIAVSSGTLVECYKEMGLVSQVFNEEILQRLKGFLAVGHNRYSTTGKSVLQNAQPILLKTHLGAVALAHNGNLINHDLLRKDLESRGMTFQSTSDSEVIAKIFALAPGETLEEKVRETVAQLRGAFSVVLATRDALIGFRDPYGIRPLCLGQINGGKGWVLSSESCALNTIGARLLREVDPGEAVIINEDGPRSFKAAPSPRHALCIFEYIYLARPDSLFHGQSVHSVRKRMGKILAREYPPGEVDGVMPIPDSSFPAAIGFSEAEVPILRSPDRHEPEKSGDQLLRGERKVPFTEGLIKNRYIARTFIQPDQRLRKQGIKLKFNPLVENIRGKKIVVVDDSIVRGNTMKAIVSLLREVGAEEVHIRITSPPMRHPCSLGVDIATYDELIASRMSVKEICAFVGADSLGYLSLDGLYEAVGMSHEKFCTGCFTGTYPQEELTALAQEKMATFTADCSISARC